MIERALERFDGNRKKAAGALKISTVTLWRKMKHAACHLEAHGRGGKLQTAKPM